jgi:hypothetical protein
VICDLTVLEGTQPEVVAVFKRAGVLVNPTAITVITKSPSGALVTYNTPNAQIVNTSTGVWTFTFPGALTEVGTWIVNFAGTAGVIVAAETSVAVKANSI